MAGVTWRIEGGTRGSVASILNSQYSDVYIVLRTCFYICLTYSDGYTLGCGQGYLEDRGSLGGTQGSIASILIRLYTLFFSDSHFVMPYEERAKHHLVSLSFP